MGARNARTGAVEGRRAAVQLHDNFGPSDRPAVHRRGSRPIDPARDIGEPGTFPYTRGIHQSGYRGKLWTMRQFAGFGTPEETNAGKRRSSPLAAPD